MNLAILILSLPVVMFIWLLLAAPKFKLHDRILTFVIAVIGCLMFSLVATWIAWQHQITEKAFHCTDGNLSGFWCDMDTHQAAGDTVFPNWTWDKLKTVRLIYEGVFYLLWLAGSAAFFQILFRRHKKEAHDYAA